VADLKGDFKVLFHDRHGDFYCWLNTAMIGTRQFLETKELDWFDRVGLIRSRVVLVLWILFLFSNAWCALDF
jgi:hypothetical protein